MKMTLRAMRVNAGYTILKASKILGISANSLYAWESGKVAPNICAMLRLSELYGCEWTDFDVSMFHGGRITGRTGGYDAKC